MYASQGEKFPRAGETFKIYKGLFPGLNEASEKINVKPIISIVCSAKEGKSSGKISQRAEFFHT